MPLVRIVVPRSVLAHPLVFSEENKGKAKANPPFKIEDILISDDTPSRNALSRARSYLSGLGLGVQLGDDRRNDLMYPWADATGRARVFLGYWKREIVGQGKRKHFSECGKSNILGGRISSILDAHPWLKPDICGGILRHHYVEEDSQVRPALQFGNKLLPIGDLSVDTDRFLHGFNARSHRFSDSIHGLRRTRDLSDRALDIIRLLCGDLVHLGYGLFQSAGLYPEDKRLNAAEQNDDNGKPNHPPIGRRFVEGVCLIIGGFLLGLRGWENFDDNRRLFRTAFIGAGLFLSICGWLVWLVTFYPWSWGWWI